MESKQENKKQIKKQVVAGFVIFRRTEDGVKYLLLYRRGSYWNFPKGHFELGETSLDTALRETKEETGIGKEDLRLIQDFRAYERFYFDRGDERIFDTVILYLAETKKVQVTVVPREHSGYGWFLYHDAIKVIGKQYVGTKRVLKLAHEFIKERQKKYAAHRAGVQTHPHQVRRQPTHPDHGRLVENHQKKEKTAP